MDSGAATGNPLFKILFRGCYFFHRLRILCLLQNLVPRNPHITKITISNVFVKKKHLVFIFLETLTYFCFIFVVRVSTFSSKPSAQLLRP